MAIIKKDEIKVDPHTFQHPPVDMRKVLADVANSQTYQHYKAVDRQTNKEIKPVMERVLEGLVKKDG